MSHDDTGKSDNNNSKLEREETNKSKR